MRSESAEQRPSRKSAAPLSRLPQAQKKRIYIGEVVASATPILLQTLLGSCIAVCLRDPAACVGGMNHILIPGRCESDDRPARCGVHAMELLINAIMRAGGDRRRLEAKVFGGGNVVSSLQSPTVGELNALFIRELLKTERIPIVAERLGGTQPVQVNFRTDTGKTTVHTVDGSRLPPILSAEDVYRCSVVQAGSGGEVTLF
jgi:chemotaxis receptor (MCP) glutamine deamidase CheD